MEHAIELRNVNKSFGSFGITDLSLKVKKGFVTGFIGANGAGKSTIIKMIMNLHQPDSGEVRVLGMNYKENEKKIKERIGFVFNDEILYKELDLSDMKKLIAPCYRQWDDLLFHQYCDRFELPLRQNMKSFSAGMKMKASLAFALSHHADLLIMDEPTTNLDPIFRREFMKLMHEVMLDEEKTIFLSTHIMSDLSSLADYITLIQKGQIVFSKGLHEIEEKYAIVRGGVELLDRDTEQYFLSITRTDNGFEALTSDYKTVEALFGNEVIIEKASLEEIMYYSRGGKADASVN
ncbi:ABC transporter ATP-binding protein [Paenibacillus sp. J2TS4]|uniref:ABC transporter ATP-binding protein n=1 Tax=Paenibacillus sp. J2TS4 TaxID=2807194 RepID=UPI001B1F09D8|nr:ABC transporter ATP-binding protein [Paenibacillus sp. J2TS4]GIP35136.1 ABC transporter ATP-binding protein [Paenibacillus sp. J2TS4]